MNRTTAVLECALLLAVTACSERQPLAPASTALPPPSFSHAPVFPDVIPLPVNPEGIAVGTGSTFYVGHIAIGSLYSGNLRTGNVALLRASDGRPMLGLKHDDRSGNVFAARGGSGTGTVVNARTGALVADFTFASPPGTTNINDVIVSRTAAHFTDSFRPALYRVPLGPAGEVLGGFDVIPLSGDWIQETVAHCGVGSGAPALPPINANGIEATPDGSRLIVSNLRVGTLYLTDPVTGVATSIPLAGGNVCFADGLLLAGHTLYVVQNLLSRIAVIAMSPDYSSGTIERYIQYTTPLTTIARHGKSIYAVTAGFRPAPAAGHHAVRFDR